MSTLSGKIALITGGAGGIGSAICQRLADEGANVIITYNSNSEKAEKLKLSLRGTKQAGGNHSTFHAPVDDSSKLAGTLKSGDQVTLSGFGTFSVAARAARTGRNPRTGEAIAIPASKNPKFKAGKGLKDTVN